MKSKIDNIKKYTELYDVYKKELTKIQREVFELYYFQDLSLTEIAETRNTSRASVQDTLNKTILILERLENNIGYIRDIKN